MYTIISGTNRSAATQKSSKAISKYFKRKHRGKKKILSSKDLNVLQENPEFSKAENEFLIPAQKILFYYS